MNMLCIPVGPIQANCYLVWDDDRNACAVDPGGEAERLAQVVEKEELRLEAILVTHGHFDHTEGVKHLAEVTGAAVYCSAQVAPVLAGTEGCSATGLTIPTLDPERIHIVTDGSRFGVGSLSISVIGTPGHTPGDVTFEIDGELFPGDLLFYRSVGRTDFPGGDFGELLASVGRLTERYKSDTVVHPGHMQSTTLGAELQFNPFLGGLSVRG